MIPTDQGPWVEAAALLRAGRNDEALAKYQELVDTHPNHRGSMMGLAQALGAVGRTDDAVALFDQVSAAMARLRVVLRAPGRAAGERRQGAGRLEGLQHCGRAGAGRP